MARKIIIIEEDDDNKVMPYPKRTFPYDPNSWICPYCGKRVYSMEVHPCNQPFLGGVNG